MGRETFMRTCTLRALTLVGLLLITSSSAFAIEATVGDIVDARSIGKVQGRLEIELKVSGEEVADIEGLRATVISATDETGRDLTDALRLEKQSRYVNVSADKSVRIYLKSPSRRASVLKELIGRLDLFMPKLDPESTIIVDDISSKSGKALEVAALKNVGVEATILTKQQYDQLGKAQSGASGAGSLVGLSNLDDKSIILKLDDSDGRIVEVEFQTESGERIRPRGSTTVGNLRAFLFAEALPAKARLKIEVATLKSVVRVPFDFENVLLP